MSEITTIRPELLSLSSQQVQALLPYFVMFGGAVVSLLACGLKWFHPRWTVFVLSIIATLLGMAYTAELIELPGQTLFNGMMAADSFSHFFNLLFMASAVLTVLASLKYLDREGLQYPEYYVLILFSALGMMFLASSLNLVMIFIALEIMSLAIYVLVGFRRADRRSNEAAMKYFVLGSAASAVLLYGATLIYGATGTLDIHAVTQHLQTHSATATSPLFVIGAWLVIAGFLFKIASVPFHMWMPDVYEGAPIPVTGFMTTGLKAAAFATFMRVFVSLGYGKGLSEGVQSHIHDILWICAVLTMVIGNLVALTQTNLKRMLAYSSIAHTGYILVGLISGPASDQGYAPVVLYLIAYAVMNIGAFGILAMVAAKADAGINLHDMAGLARRHPWLAFAMAVFLFSMAGIPPTAGFAAKYLLFYSAIQANEMVLVVISVLCSAISVYYYLRVLVYMYMRDLQASVPANRISIWSSLAVATMVVLTIQIGVLPSRVVMAAKRAVTSL